MNFYEAKFEREKKEDPNEWFIQATGPYTCELVNLPQCKIEEEIFDDYEAVFSKDGRKGIIDTYYEKDGADYVDIMWESGSIESCKQSSLIIKDKSLYLS